MAGTWLLLSSFGSCSQSLQLSHCPPGYRPSTSLTTLYGGGNPIHTCGGRARGPAPGLALLARPVHALGLGLLARPVRALGLGHLARPVHALGPGLPVRLARPGRALGLVHLALHHSLAQRPIQLHLAEAEAEQGSAEAEQDSVAAAVAEQDSEAEAAAVAAQDSAGEEEDSAVVAAPIGTEDYHFSFHRHGPVWVSSAFASGRRNVGSAVLPLAGCFVQP